MNFKSSQLQKNPKDESIVQIDNQIKEFQYAVKIYNNIKKIINVNYQGSFYDEIKRLREINKKTNLNYQRRKVKDMMSYIPYAMESTMDLENDIKDKYDKNEDYKPSVRRGQNASNNNINKYQDEIETMKAVNEYRENELNQKCPHDNRNINIKLDCEICRKIIDENSVIKSFV